MNALGTSPVVVSDRHSAGWFGKKVITEVRRFDDWTVDGTPLRQLVAERYGVLQDQRLPDEHPPLREDAFWPRLAVQNLRSLLGEAPGDFGDRRVVLLYCPVDADLSCGALSAALVVGEDVVEWRDIGWQDAERPFDVVDDGFDPPLSLRFQRAPYAELLHRLIDKYELLATRAGILGS